MDYNWYMYPCAHYSFILIAKIQIKTENSRYFLLFIENKFKIGWTDTKIVQA